MEAFSLEKYREYMQTAYKYDNSHLVFIKLHYLIRFDNSLQVQDIRETEDVAAILLELNRFDSTNSLISRTFRLDFEPYELHVYKYLDDYTRDFIIALTNNDFINKIIMLQII